MTQARLRVKGTSFGRGRGGVEDGKGHKIFEGGKRKKNTGIY